MCLEFQKNSVKTVILNSFSKNDTIRKKNVFQKCSFLSVKVQFFKSNPSRASLKINFFHVRLAYKRIKRKGGKTQQFFNFLKKCITLPLSQRETLNLHPEYLTNGALNCSQNFTQIAIKLHSRALRTCKNKAFYQMYTLH